MDVPLMKAIWIGDINKSMKSFSLLTKILEMIL